VRDVAASFDSFFDAHYDKVRRSLAVAFGDATLAEELTQDAFTRALASWRRVSRMERPAGWVYIVALRAGRRRAKEQAPAPADWSADFADPADGVASRVAIDEAIARLPERQRTALVLRYLADLPLDEIADAMGCALGTVKSTLHAAVSRLGTTLDEEDWYAR
jgi:RNA polymerase sigma-70 factor (ECF subfamily)